MKNADEFFDKTKEMADKAEAKIGEAFEKVKTSDTYAKITNAMDQVGDYVEQKIEKLKESDIPEKVEKFWDKAENQTETIIEQAKAYGSTLASDVDEVIEKAKAKFSGDSKKPKKV